MLSQTRNKNFIKIALETTNLHQISAIKFAYSSKKNNNIMKITGCFL